MKRILTLCTGNSCRSQMAEGWFRHFGGDAVEVFSAGVLPERVNPNAIFVMREEGIDISTHTSDPVDKYINKEFDYVITVCDNAREMCPVFHSNAVLIHESFPDPAKARGTEGEVLNEYRKEIGRASCRERV